MDRRPIEAFYAAVRERDLRAVGALCADRIAWRVRNGAVPINRRATRAQIVEWFTSLPPEVESVEIVVDTIVPVRESVLASGHHALRFTDGDRLDIPFVHSWQVRDGRICGLVETVEPAAMEPLLSRGLNAGDARGPRPGTA